MESLKYRSSKSWQLRNKLMAVTLLLSEMEMFDKQTCDMCPYCTGKRKNQPQPSLHQNHPTVAEASLTMMKSSIDKPTTTKFTATAMKSTATSTKSTTTATKSTIAAKKSLSDKLVEEKFAESLTTNGSEYDELSSVHDKIQIYSAAQAQLNKTIEKGRSLKTVNNYAPVHKSAAERENVWLLQDQVSRGTSSSSSTSSDTDSGHLTGSDSSDYVTAPSKASAAFVLKVSSV